MERGGNSKLNPFSKTQLRFFFTFNLIYIYFKSYNCVIQLIKVQFSWGVVIPKNFLALQFGERNSEAGSMTQWKIHRVLESDQTGFESQP